MLLDKWRMFVNFGGGDLLKDAFFGRFDRVFGFISGQCCVSLLNGSRHVLGLVVLGLRLERHDWVCSGRV